ncbi:hypothetical protein [Burkholderia cenocepacia]|uniref:hypothetical protein n=1 Tax=Burkholderia cenocepacia TaxID=95486 RepID=UPI000F59CF60|nr:hypothetical protein [Burkholderia cenocepacia]MBR8511711.1 hypothetical protein [Burkholderia cenocepacia]
MKVFKALIASVLVLGVLYVFFSKILINIPTDTAEKYRQMKIDMDWIAGQGGVVVLSKENERGSAALIISGVDARSVDEKILRAYSDAFILRGWTAVESGAKKKSFCKNGVHATLNLVPEWFPEKQINIYDLSMEYNSGTVMNCRR